MLKIVKESENHIPTVKDVGLGDIFSFRNNHTVPEGTFYSSRIYIFAENGIVNLENGYSYSVFCDGDYDDWEVIIYKNATLTI